MKALSIRQPWAWAIVAAGKDVENRTWATGYRGPLLIHTGKTYDHDGHAWIENALGIAVPDDLPRGGIVGHAELIGCVEQSESDWFFGPVGFLLAHRRPLPFVECRGRLGIFDTNITIATVENRPEVPRGRTA